MPFLVKTDTSTIPAITESKPALPRRTVSYLPANRQKAVTEPKKTAPVNQEIPISKWIMPAQPQGYLAARQNDMF